MRQAIVFLLCLSACATSQTNGRLVDEYRARGTLSLVFERVAVIVLNGGPELRSAMEAHIVSEQRGSRLAASHTVLRPEDQRSYETVRQRLLDQKFDGAVTLRLIRGTEVNAAESEAGVKFTNYADSVPLGEPEFGTATVLVEASFYNLSDEKLVWRGIAEIPRSNDARTMARDAAGVIRARLRETGLVHD
jgi:hypothetical protein